MAMSEVYTVREACTVAGVDRGMFYQWRYKGLLPGVSNKKRNMKKISSASLERMKQIKSLRLEGVPYRQIAIDLGLGDERQNGLRLTHAADALRCEPNKLKNLMSITPRGVERPWFWAVTCKKRTFGYAQFQASALSTWYDWVTAYVDSIYYVGRSSDDGAMIVAEPHSAPTVFCQSIEGHESKPEVGLKFLSALSSLLNGKPRSLQQPSFSHDLSAGMKFLIRQAFYPYKAHKGFMRSRQLIFLVASHDTLRVQAGQKEKNEHCYGARGTVLALKSETLRDALESAAHLIPNVSEEFRHLVEMNDFFDSFGNIRRNIAHDDA